MKNKILFVAFLVALFTGCKKDEPEDQPVALFSFSQNELTVTFTNSSQNAQSYVWNFGDGQTSKEKNPVHTYVRSEERV